MQPSPNGQAGTLELRTGHVQRSTERDQGDNAPAIPSDLENAGQGARVLGRPEAPLPEATVIHEELSDNILELIGTLPKQPAGDDSRKTNREIGTQTDWQLILAPLKTTVSVGEAPGVQRVKAPNAQKKNIEKRPCPECGKPIGAIPRHLRNVHGCTAAEAKYLS